MYHWEASLVNIQYQLTADNGTQINGICSATVSCHTVRTFVHLTKSATHGQNKPKSPESKSFYVAKEIWLCRSHCLRAHQMQRARVLPSAEPVPWCHKSGWELWPPLCHEHWTAAMQPVGRMHRSLKVHCTSDAISDLADTNELGYAKSKSVTSWPNKLALLILATIKQVTDMRLEWQWHTMNTSKARMAQTSLWEKSPYTMKAKVQT